MRTGDNARFLRFWFEVSRNKTGIRLASAKMAEESKMKWFPYCKGGPFRRWYGNNEYVVNWEDNGYEIKENTRLVYPQLGDNLGWKISNEHYYFKKGITWSGVTMNTFGVRSYEEGMIFDSGANGLFVFDDDYYFYFVGLLNTKVIEELINIINPTVNTGCGVIAKLPTIISNENKTKIDQLVMQNISISKREWDSYETSWDFNQHPFITFKGKTVEESFGKWNDFTQNQFIKLKANEEELNSIFIQVYGLQNELTPIVDEMDVTVRKADRLGDIKSFISYAVGCMFGRYSLDEEGLVFAGGKFEPAKYQKYSVDSDNILPLVSGAYFEDDIVSRLIEFVNLTFGEETLVENLDYIAETLGKKEGETAKEAIRRYFLNDFYKDHLQIYKKRPIYWLFTSGKQKAFNCLIYMHRYDKSTLSRIRTDYLHELQNRLDAEKKSLLRIIEGGGTAKEISNAKKELKAIDLKIEELKAYDELLHHMADMQIEINLDDGVAVNYAKFNGLLAKLD